MKINIRVSEGILGLVATDAVPARIRGAKRAGFRLYVTHPDDTSIAITEYRTGMALWCIWRAGLTPERRSELRDIGRNEVERMIDVNPDAISASIEKALEKYGPANP